MKIPENDRLGVTAVLLMCCYREHEFFRVGYYVNIESLDAPVVPMSDDGAAAEALPPMPPPVDPTRLTRNILVSQPRVTRFPIDWE
jgi:histone chaperone ASF1